MKIEKVIFIIFSIVSSFTIFISLYFGLNKNYTQIQKTLNKQNNIVQSLLTDHFEGLSSGAYNDFNREASKVLYAQGISSLHLRSSISDSSLNIFPIFVDQKKDLVSKNCVKKESLGLITALLKTCYKQNITEYFDEDKKTVMFSVNWITLTNPFQSSTLLNVLQKSLLFSFIGLVISFGIYLWLRKILVIPLKYITAKISNREVQGMALRRFKRAPLEINQLAKSIIKLESDVCHLNMELLKKAKDKAEIDLAKQVAHDIRSPLSALNMIMKDLNNLPETTRLIIRSSIQRIQDIANHLSSKRQKEHHNIEKYSVSSYLLSPCIEEIISEKRLHFRRQLNLHIQSHFGESYGLFSKINLIEFKRLLSNLINNAVEAFGEKSGTVTVHLQEECQNNQEIQIIVEDNGKGIPQKIISQLGEKGASFGKENHQDSGSGLGLYHAKKTVEDWQGNFKIESKEGYGTKIILTLPKEKAPTWFVSNIEVKEGAAIVILDDDQGIHQTWNQKLNERGFLKKHLFHLSCPEDFSKWIKEESLFFEKILYLCDFELIGFQKTGLDLIEEFSLGKNAILVTSHYEEDEIQRRCKESGIKLIPKMIVAHVPITVERPSVEATTLP